MVGGVSGVFQYKAASQEIVDSSRAAKRSITGVCSDGRAVAAALRRRILFPKPLVPVEFWGVALFESAAELKNDLRNDGSSQERAGGAGDHNGA